VISDCGSHSPSEMRMRKLCAIRAQRRSCVKVLVESNLSFHEAAASAGSEAVSNRRRQFRIADNVVFIVGGFINRWFSGGIPFERMF
jgi:hypothetical protein